MAKDDRLDLGRYIQNPFNRRGEIAKRLDFDDLFRSKPEAGQYPWNPSRFGQQDLMRRAMTRKINLNPDLEFVGNTPFFDDNREVTEAYDMFGLGRFNRPEDYELMKVGQKLHNALRTNLISIPNGLKHTNSAQH